MDRIVRIVAAFLTLFAILGGVVLRSEAPVPGAAVTLATMPLIVGEWTGRDIAVDARTLEFLRSDALLMRAYQETEDSPPVWLLVDYHRTQGLGATIHSPRICYPGAGWTVEQARVAADVDEREVCWLNLRRDGEDMLALYWYDTRWGRSAREFALKAHIMRSAIARRESDAVMCRVSTPVVENDEFGARDRLLRFLSVAEAELYKMLPFADETS